MTHVHKQPSWEYDPFEEQERVRMEYDKDKPPTDKYDEGGRYDPHQDPTQSTANHKRGWYDEPIE